MMVWSGLAMAFGWTGQRARRRRERAAAVATKVVATMLMVQVLLLLLISASAAGHSSWLMKLIVADCVFFGGVNWFVNCGSL